ncbi:hypothetical protein [Deinococcus aquaticus]|uniref:hypothetical protein n=1 Tax=Deinococcus aquaticus TaxID=328692 RepID=UPI003F4531DF
MRHILAVLLLTSSAAAQSMTPPSGRVLAAGVAKALGVNAPQAWEDATSPACRAAFQAEVKGIYGGSRQAALDDMGGTDLYCTDLTPQAAQAAQRDLVGVVKRLVPGIMRVYREGNGVTYQVLAYWPTAQYRVQVMAGKFLVVVRVE